MAVARTGQCRVPMIGKQRLIQLAKTVADWLILERRLGAHKGPMRGMLRDERPSNHRAGNAAA